MEKKSIIAIVVAILVGISLIISIPVLTLSSGLSNYGNIEKTLSYFYMPTNSSPIEKLNLNVDVGDVEIKYVTTPVDYYAKIQVDIEMMGQLIAGREYLDYFSVVWNITSPPPTFTMLVKSDTWFDPSLWSTHNVDIIVTLNANILFDINITINEKGNVHYIVPYAVTINNVDVNTNEGDIFYDFQSYCILEGNITGIANDGDIELMAYNPEYTRNTTWTYNSISGDITINIIHSNHYKIMNATITGSLVGNVFGDIVLSYYDNTANIGARVTLNDTVQALDTYGSDWVGFEIEILKDLEEIPFGYELTSLDFPAITNYNLLFRGLTLHSYEGKYYVHLSSS